METIVETSLILHKVWYILCCFSLIMDRKFEYDVTDNVIDKYIL